MDRTYTLEELSPVLDFIGYGSLDAPVWFLGPEEAGNLGTIEKRLSFSPIEDLRDAHISKLDIHDRHSESEKIYLQPTWGGMCHVMLRLNGQEPSAKAKVRYQADKLGRLGGETFLLELLPMPNESLKHWNYGNLGVAELRSRRPYYRYLGESRQARITQLIRGHAPKVVVVYGRTLWHRKLKRIFEDTSFETIKGFYVGRFEGSLVISCGHFSDNRQGNTNMVKKGNLDRLVETITDLGYSHTSSI